jgi:colanic acid biosynthesis glycosyl transferase WcaI
LRSAPKTLLLTLVYKPDSVSTALLLADLTRRLDLLGHKITVVTTTPHYNRDEVALAAQPLRPHWGMQILRSDYGPIPVYHARVKPKGKRILARLVDYARFHALSFMASLSIGTYDIVLSPSPPLTIGIVAAALARLRGARFVYNVQEVYPDIAVSLGVLRNKFIIRMLELLERFIYRRADVVVVISERFRKRILEKGVPAAKLQVIPNFVDVDVMTPRPRKNEFSRAHGLDGCFVVLYAGNIGLTQDFETVLQAARRLADLPSVIFLIVGDGAQKSRLEQRVATEAVANVRLLPYQPAAQVPDMYASSDLCLVPMIAGTARDTFPSKIYTIMAAARPVVVCADADSELSWVVQESRCGYAIPPQRADLLEETVRKARSAPEDLDGMSRRGREYVVLHHSPDAIAEKYDLLLRRLACRVP